MNVGGQYFQSHPQYLPGFRPPTQSYPTPPYPIQSQPSQPYPNPSVVPQSNFQSAPQEQKSSLEDSLKAFMQLTGQSIMEIKNSNHLNTQAISKLENQVGRLANQMGEREKGKFPSQPVPNPKGQFAINNPSTSGIFT